MVKKNRMEKNGFTMMELIFVIAIIAGLMAVFIPKITSNANKSEVSSVLGSDIQTILSKASEWKTMDSDTDGTFGKITTQKLSDYLPDNMSYDSGSGCIKSSGFGGQICYKIASDKITNNGDSVKIFVDASRAIGSKKTRQSAETTGMNIMVKYSSDKAHATKSNKASELGDPNKDFKTDGDATDGIFGVRKIAQ